MKVFKFFLKSSNFMNNILEIVNLEVLLKSPKIPPLIKNF